MNAHQEITFHLAKDEVLVYNMLCREMDVPNDEYRTGRKVECPLFHLAEINVGFCLAGASRVDVESEEHFEDVTDWADIGEGILRKCATAAREAGVVDDLEEMVDNDPRLHAEGGFTEEDRKVAEQFWRLYDASKRL